MKNLIQLIILLFTTAVFSQVGHLMGGVGSVNTSMGGAATGQAIDISGALQWNPASISTFDGQILNLDVGLFFAAPELSSSLPEAMGGFSGTTTDDKSASPMPALAFVWGKPDSKHTFGVSAFGVSGFGVDFAESNSNPINMAQPNGFGHVASNYMHLQVGLTYAYEIFDQLSIGIEPVFNYATLELAPNPLASPSQTLGYPEADNATAMGFGAQIGLYYDSGVGLTAGLSYKTVQTMSDLEFKNTYLDGSAAPDVAFNMDFPAIYSLGVGYSNKLLDVAVDYRVVDYKNTDGFAESGWVIAEEGPYTGFPTGAVKGFGWENIYVISAGIQYKGFKKAPIRVGLTHNSVPVTEELVFFSVSAPAIIENAFQIGMGYEITDNFTLNGVYHHGMSNNNKTEGTMLNPTPAIDFNEDGMPDGPWDATANPLGAIPGTKVGYSMTTDLIMLGISYTFNK